MLLFFCLAHYVASMASLAYRLHSIPWPSLASLASLTFPCFSDCLHFIDLHGFLAWPSRASMASSAPLTFPEFLSFLGWPSWVLWLHWLHMFPWIPRPLLLGVLEFLVFRGLPWLLWPSLNSLASSAFIGLHWLRWLPMARSVHRRLQSFPGFAWPSVNSYFLRIPQRPCLITWLH